VATPPGAQLGLHYGDSIDLRVRYHWNDGPMTAISGARVKFAIFDDPGGSTLASDHGDSDSDGIAHVTLTGGMSEASFSVRATADGAPDALFYVSVSKHDFVSLNVTLTGGDPIANVAEGQALLYTMTSCAQLPPADVPPTPLRQVSAPPGQPLPLVNLLSMDYVVVGRLTNPQGHLVASGCVDLPSALIPAGTMAAVPIPLSVAVPSLAGSYALSSTLAWSMTVVTAIEAPWHKLTACPTSPADLLLDGIEARAPTFMSAIEGQRMPADGKGCRPGGTTLDGQLVALLTAAGTPGAQLSAIVPALDAQLAAGATLSSTLAVESSDGKLWATHSLGQLTVGKAYDIASFGLPVVSVNDVAIAFPSGALGSAMIGPHAFTLGIGPIERRAFDEQTLAVKLPSLSPATPTGFTDAMVAAVAHGGKTGCPAVEDLICSVTGAAGCAGQIAPACAMATQALAASLENAFVPANPLDLPLAGSATAVDSDGDLAVDRLTGVWNSTDSTATATGTFTGMRQ
jgi:hypothetical protein